MVDVETNECLDNNGGCWQNKAANLTACKVKIVTYWLIRYPLINENIQYFNPCSFYFYFYFYVLFIFTFV